MQIGDYVGQYHNSTATAAEGLTPNKGVEQLVSTVRSMTAGNIFEGTINYFKNGQVILGLSNGQQITARLADASMKLVQGDSMFFQVKENDGEQIKIAPYKIAGAGANLTLISALSAAGLPMEGEFLGMVDKMMQEQMPIDRNSLIQMAKVVLANKEADVSTLVEMKKIGLSITKESISQYENYKSDKQSIGDGIRNIVEELPKLMGKDSFELGQMNKEILSIFTENAKEMAPKELSQFLDAPALEKLDSLVKEFLGIHTESNEATETGEEMQTDIKGLEQQKLIHEDTKSVDLLNLVKRALEESPKKESIVKLFSSEEFQEVIKDVIKEQWAIKPEELVKEENKIGKLYEKLAKQLNQLERAVKAAGGDTLPIQEMAMELKNNVEFMNQINQFYQYVQIPLKLSGQNATGELVVYTNKKDLSDPNKELSAFLHLDLDHLGSTDVSVKMLQKDVNTKFYLADDDAFYLVLKYQTLLEERLKKKGYSFNMEVVNDVKKVNIVEDVLKQGLPSMGHVKRYSFDIRA